MGIIMSGNFQGGNCPVGVILNENFPGGNSPCGSCPQWEFSVWELSGGNHPGGNFLGGSVPSTEEMITSYLMCLITQFFYDKNIMFERKKSNNRKTFAKHLTLQNNSLIAKFRILKV